MERVSDTSWHHLPIEDVLRMLAVDTTTGLSSGEVAVRRKKFGRNRVTIRRTAPAWLRFIKQFNQPLVYILVLAGTVTLFLGEWVDSTVILSVVLINAIVGFIQEAKAGRAIDALASMIATETTVRRDGQKRRVDSEELVVGDVVLLQSGDRVPADLRLFDVRNLHVDESALTGESLSVSKNSGLMAPDTILAERGNLAYAGTFVTSGQAESVVSAIGDETETGRIARLISTATELSTPLTRKIAHFSKRVLWMIIGLAGATFAVGVTRGEKPVDMFMAAVALAVGAIPEGLPAAVTIVLAIGVSRMAKRQVIIRKLPAVETLGSTTVICSDKTGTLTENEMTVQEIFTGGRMYDVTGIGYEPEGDLRLNGSAVSLSDHSALAECLRTGALCNETVIVRKDGRLKIQGDPTEAALLVALEKGGLSLADTRRRAPMVDMIPFESEHMFRATLHDVNPGRIIFMVGAAERLLDRSSDTLGEFGTTVPLDKKAVENAANQMAGRGLRVIAMARRHANPDHDKLEHSDVEAGLTFLGIQGMMDPPRAAVISAIRHLHDAGIAVKMITGDHAVTARVIADQVGLAGTPPPAELTVLTGRELDAIPESDFPGVVERTTVFARVAPEQKLRLVKALQSRGHIVAMTGDGVNDAPALKQADIGVAMGISGTDVAKEAASMVLVDDNFSSIEAAVEEGRGVFDNLTKFIVWIIPTNLGEALMLLTAIVLGLALPLLPLQLLWINLTDTLLGLSLAFEPKDSDVMRRAPRKPSRPLLTFPLIMRTGLVSLLMLGGGLGLFLWELKVQQAGLAAARTAAVNVVVLTQMAYLFNCRSLQRSVFAIGLFTNRWTLVGSAAMLVAQLLFTYTPVMNRIFRSAPIGAESWMLIAGVAATAFVAVEFEKWIRFGRRRVHNV